MQKDYDKNKWGHVGMMTVSIFTIALFSKIKYSRVENLNDIKTVLKYKLNARKQMIRTTKIHIALKRKNRLPLNTKNNQTHTKH